MTKRMHHALCCDCGTMRLVSARYSKRIEDPRTNGEDLAALKCETCGRTTKHAVLTDAVVLVEPPTPAPLPVARRADPELRDLVTATAPDVDVVVAEYAQWMDSWAASGKTIAARSHLARSRLRKWGLDGLTTDNVRDWLSREGLSAWSRATYYAHLKSLCEFLVAAGYLESSPMEAVRKPSRPKMTPKPLSEAEVDQVLAAAVGRTRDIIQLALLTGLRAHEIAKIRAEDITPTGVRVLGKGGKDATLPTHPEVWALALRYSRTGYLFPSPYGGHITPDTLTGIVSKFFDTLEIEGSIHRCRHTYGTRLLRSGVNIRIVQELMRHTNLETTAGYTAVSEDELAAAIALLPAAGTSR